MDDPSQWCPGSTYSVVGEGKVFLSRTAETGMMGLGMASKKKLFNPVYFCDNKNRTWKHGHGCHMSWLRYEERAPLREVDTWNYVKTYIIFYAFCLFVFILFKNVPPFLFLRCLILVR